MMGFGLNQFGGFCHGGGIGRFSGFGGFGMMFGGLLLAGLLVYGLVVLVRREQNHSYANAANGAGRNEVPYESPLAILDERYARGELDDEAYAKRKSELRKR